jgi:hypothetical protein
MNEIRIIEPPSELPEGYTISTFEWPNPPSPRPQRPRSERYIKAQERLNRDRKAFKNACIFAGL